jgi:hypothetical protein
MLSLLSFAYALPVFAATKTTIEQKALYGRWHCQHSIENTAMKMQVNIDYDVNIARNGTSNGTGTLIFRLPSFPSLEYRVTNDATWQLKGDQLHIASSNIQSHSVSHPEFETFFKLQQFIPTQVSETVKILKLTHTHLEVTSPSYGGIYTCIKA